MPIIKIPISPRNHNVAQKGGRCVAHGGAKRCKVNKCEKIVAQGGKCIAHGAKRERKLCKFNGCEKIVAQGGKVASTAMSRFVKTLAGFVPLLRSGAPSDKAKV